ncbi:MAG: glycosyltransferase family 2 protein [Lewinella sp.]|nr:glycosyltransferase family 2 protein [Lewinella sp.]
MVNTPAVSIVMPLYNKAPEVLATIASVQAQTVTDWELVVVDDGSTDRGPELVRGLEDPRVRVFSQSNAGVSAARNQGIASAKAELIAFLDADDRWQPEFLGCVLALARDYPEAQWFATGYEIRRQGQAAFEARLLGVDKGFSRGLLGEYFLVAMQSDPPVWTSACVVRRDAIVGIGGFPLGISSGEDLLTWARLAVRFPLAYDARALAIFEVSGHERRPDPTEQVSRALADLLDKSPGTPGLRAYLGQWFRMQAVMAMRFSETVLARRSAWQAFRHGPVQWRNGYTLLLSWLPSALRQAMDASLRRLARRAPPAAPAGGDGT